MSNEQLIDAICAWGWDHEAATATVATATAALATAPAGDFLVACVTGDVDTVRAALTQSPALATTPVAPRDWPPLLYVSYSLLLRTDHAPRILDVARLLVAHGADPNAHYVAADSKFPALYASIAVTHSLELSSLLVEAGADPNDDQSLYHAAEQFRTDILDLLFKAKLDPAHLSYCLLHKIDFQHEAGIRWFLDHGADPNARHPQSGETALHWAIKRASTLDIIERLLAHGADPNARTLAGHTRYPEIRAWTPLDLARRVARGDLADALIAHGAIASPPSVEGALIFACLAGTHTTPINVAELAPFDRDLLAHVAQQNQTDAAVRLIALGFPLDAQGWMAATPLHWAACRGNAALTRALLAANAPVIDVGGYFQTPHHTALRRRWPLANPDYDAVVAALT